MLLSAREVAPHTSEDTAKERIFLKISAIDSIDFLYNPNFLARISPHNSSASLFFALQVCLVFFPKQTAGEVVNGNPCAYE